MPMSTLEKITFQGRIVIPVVVGSSPIGHPKNSLQHKDLRHSSEWRFFFLDLDYARGPVVGELLT